MTAEPIRLSDITICFQGVVPSILVTADADGIPNVAYISQVHYVDDRHVALSRQFFNKTSRNLDLTRRAAVEVYDPLTFACYRLRLAFLRSESAGPLFETMSLRIQAIASHTGMTGVFRLIAADVFRVEKVERVDAFLTSYDAVAARPVTLDGYRSEMRGMQWISDQINRAADLDALFDTVLEALERFFGFTHTRLLLHEEGDRLVTIASRGYAASGVGAEVKLGEGLIGTAARERRVLRMTGLDESLRYGRAVRRELEEAGSAIAAEVPMPGLPDAQSALVIPLWVRDRLIGALAAESRDPLGFAEWHEAFLEIIGNQIALGIDRMLQRGDADDGETSHEPRSASGAAASPKKRTFTWYASDECLFVDGEYLIRNVPAKILWRLLGEWKERGRTEFTNRELRLDASLGLPEFKDNLESRLILLRRRLDEKKAGVAIRPAGRGRFSLVVESELAFETR